MASPLYSREVLMGVSPPPFQIGSILYGDSRRVVNYMKEIVPQIATAEFGPHQALGVMRKGKLVGGVIYYFYRPQARSIMICAEFSGASWALPGTISRLLHYPFVHLKCQRISAATGVNNTRTRAFMEFLGAKVEGVLRRGYDGVQDEAIYGLLIEELNWRKIDVL
jgi:hypothetical protein